MHKIFLFVIIARARHTNCFSPLDKFFPFSSITKSRPAGSFLNFSSNWHFFNAFHNLLSSFVLERSKFSLFKKKFID